MLVALLFSSAGGIVRARPASAAAFAGSNLVVVRVGDGTAPLSSAATPVFLDEFSPSGALVQSVPLPRAASGANSPLTMSGSATSEGALARSADGRFLTLAGYASAPGTPSIASTTTPGTPRVVARVDGGGSVDTSTTIADAFSGNNVRGAVTDDGSRVWAVGGNSGVRLAPLGSPGSSSSVSTTVTNLRTASIAAGQLYVTTGSGTTGVYKVGTGTPTTTAAASLVQGAPSPFASVFLDRDPAVPGVDTLYVADDAASPGGGVLKLSFDGATWSARGSFRPEGSGARGLTGEVLADGTVSLVATTSTTLSRMVKVTDTAAFDAPMAASGLTLATAAANTVLRGVAYAPQAPPVDTAPSITAQPQDAAVVPGATATLSVTAEGTGPLGYQWYTGSAGDVTAPVAGATAASFTTPALTTTTSYWVRVSNTVGSADSRNATVTVNDTPPGNTAPTIAPGPVEPLALTLGDPFNPPALRTVDVADVESPAIDLTISVTSSNSAVATGGSTGTGSTRTLTVNPVGVGRATLTVTVSDGGLTASTTFPVAVSGPLPAGTLNHYGASDASTAVDLGAGTMVVGDDETNVLRTYATTASRYPIGTFDLRAAGLALRDGDPTREIDIEASARSGNTIYWLGSHGQSKDAKTRLNRQELFTTAVSGTGTGATLAVGGSYQNLRDDMVAWDRSDGHGLGADALGLAAAATRAPEGDGGATGFNIEGAELAPDGTTLYVAFRGPLTAEGSALVVPVTNLAQLVTANPTTGVTAAFGAPLRWDLRGRGVREIRRSTGGTYLVIAGPSGVGTGGSAEFRLFSWNGDPASPPLLRAGSLDDVAAAGKPEAIVSVPDPLASSSAVQVLTDSGETVWYGDSVIAKDLDLVLRKATSALVTVGTPPPCTTGTVPIGTVQGTGDISPRAGQTVTVLGTVVGDYEGAPPGLRGFYLQDAGDGDPATSDGIFVFDSSADLVTNGNVVQVTGSVSEFQGQTQLTSSASAVEPCGRQGNVTPTDMTLPRVTAADLEPYEGMLVRVNQALTVTEHFQLGRFGQVVVSSGDRLRQPTAVLPASDTVGVASLQAANALNRLIIDDDRQIQNPDPIVFGRGGQPLSAGNTLRGGDTVTDPTGVLTYTWAGSSASGNAYRLRPVGALGGSAVFDPSNPRPTAPPIVGTGGVKVAAANLLNFFNTFTGCTFGTMGGPADCRGAENSTEYERQLVKEVESISFLGADVVAYMEMENDGYGPASAVQSLVDALNAKDGPGAWAFVNPDAATGITDSAGTDAIKSGLLYRTASVTPVAGATFADQNPIFQRRPVAQTFTTGAGARFSVVSNHFKSKGSCPASGVDTDQGDGQGCWNDQRTAQATELAGWLRDVVVPAAGDPDVLIAGDLNAYAGEDPIAALETAGYTNLIKRFEGPDAYSYVFDGQWGYLDHAMASTSLVGQATGAGDAHHNADEPAVLDYNTNFKSTAQIASLYAPDRFRTSDHDPVLVGLDLTVTVAPTTLTVDSSVNPSVLGAPVTFTATVGAPAGIVSTGTVQFSVDGAATGPPVSLVDGVASAPANASLSAGVQAISAAYSGTDRLAPSVGSLTQVVRHVIHMSAPARNAHFTRGASVRIAVQVTDADGRTVGDAEATALVAPGQCRLKVSVSGAQTLAPTCPTYNEKADTFMFTWRSGKTPPGNVAITATITYPGTAVTASASVAVTLT